MLALRILIKMDEFTLDSNEDNLNASDEEEDSGFMQGYADDSEVPECAECGSALNSEKKFTQLIDGETHRFCSKECMKEFEESIN